MRVSIPAEDARRFRAYMEDNPDYHAHERGYKDAVRAVLSRVLSPASLTGPNGARRIAELFDRPTPDLHALGLSEGEASAVLADLGGGGLRRAIDNLASGPYAFTNYNWVPGAVSAGLGKPIVTAFRELLDESTDLAGRVERFREELGRLRRESQRRRRVTSNRTTRPVQLQFIAVFLGGYDRTRYTFYHFAALRAGYRQYASSEFSQWTPAGEKYADVCLFMSGVLRELRKHGVPAKDMIDAQSFIWLTRPGGPLDSAARKPTTVTIAPAPTSSVAATELEVEAIVAGRRGQGFGLTTAERHAVEHRAMDEVERFSREEGWDVLRVYRTDSYDLHATRGPEEQHIEVKGTTGGLDTVLLTWREVDWALTHSSESVLAVVYDIKLDKGAKPPVASEGTLRFVKAWPVPLDSEDLKAITFRYTIPATPRAKGARKARPPRRSGKKRR